MSCAPDPDGEGAGAGLEPIAAPPDAAEAIARACAQSPAATLLYVEDEPLNALLMSELLRSVAPWTLHLAADGAAGVERARVLRPDLVLTDINLPGLDGFGLLRALREDPSLARIPCVALSADAHPRQVERALAAGFDDYLTKPIDLRELVMRVHDRLQRQRA